MTNKKNIVKLFSITLIIFVLIGVMFYGGFFNGEETENPLRQRATISSVLPVKAMVMKLAPLTDKLIAGGTIMADEQVMMAAEIPGRIEKIILRKARL